MTRLYLWRVNVVLQPQAVDGMQPGMLHGPIGNFTTLDTGAG